MSARDTRFHFGIWLLRLFISVLKK